MLTILVFDARARCRYAKSKFSYRYVEWRNFYVLAHNINRLRRHRWQKSFKKNRGKSKCYRKICGIKMNECIKTANGYEKHRSVMLLCHTLLYSGSDCVPLRKWRKTMPEINKANSSQDIVAAKWLYCRTYAETSMFSMGWDTKSNILKMYANGNEHIRVSEMSVRICGRFFCCVNCIINFRLFFFYAK